MKLRLINKIDDNNCWADINVNVIQSQRKVWSSGLGNPTWIRFY